MIWRGRTWTLGIGLGIIAAAAGVVLALPEDSPPPTPITVQLDWFHKGDYGGYYAADQNGDYADENVAVTLLPGGPGHDVITPVVDGVAQFGMASGTKLISLRVRGDRVRAVACIYRRSPLVFAVLSDSGIAGPADFPGKTIRVAAHSRATLDAVLGRVGVAPDSYAVSTTKDLAQFYSRKIDVWVGYMVGGVRIAREQGYDLTVIHPDDYGVHDYAKCIFTTDDVIDESPELVLRFLRATFRGWDYAIKNPDSAAMMIAAYTPDVKMPDEVGRLIAALPLINTGEDHVGWMKPGKWEAIAENLRMMGLLTGPFDVTQVYTMRFIRDVYDPGE